MTVEQMCCTREQSKRLRELGIDQKSYFYHTIVHVVHLPYMPIQNKGFDTDIIGSAFNVAELGIMLPIGWYTAFDGTHWHCKSPKRNALGMIGLTQAMAMAFELISLLEIGDYSVEQVNPKLHE